VTRSDGAGVATLLPRFRDIVARSGEPVALVTAYSAIGCGTYWSGEFHESAAAFAEGRRLFETDEFRRFAATYGYGAGIYSYAFGMLTLWCQGFPDQADAVRTDLLRIADLARDPYVTAIALGMGATLAHDRDTPEVELDFGDRLTALGVEQRLPLWRAAGAVGRGGALLRRGHADAALELIRGGVEGFRAIGVLCSYSFYLPMLAEAYLLAGRFADGEASLDEADRLYDTHVARLNQSETQRLRGEIALQRGDTGAAEAAFRQALGTARGWGAKGYELRAACALGALLRRLGRRDEARAEVADVLGWFTEGFDTPDLETARALLAEL
jgi:tetratricopeptide (TPR) repeat protein